MLRRVICAGLLVLVSGISGCSNYGTKLDVDGNDLFYTDNVTKDEASKLGDYLKETGYFQEGREYSVQLDRDGETYLLRLVVVDDYKQRDSYPGAYQLLAAGASHSVFDGKPVAVHLTDTKLNTVETIEAEDVGKIVKADKFTLHYTKRVKKEDAEKTLAYLKESQKDNTKTVGQLYSMDSADGVFIIRIRVEADYKNHPGYPGGAQIFAAQVSHHALDDRPVETHYTTLGWKTREKLPSSAAGRILEFDGSSLYYTEGVSEESAKKLGGFLKQIGVFGKEKVSVQVRREGKTYLLRFTVKTEAVNQPKVQQHYRQIGNLAGQRVLGGQPVKVHLTDQYFKTLLEL